MGVAGSTLGVSLQARLGWVFQSSSLCTAQYRMQEAVHQLQSKPE